MTRDYLALSLPGPDDDVSDWQPAADVEAASPNGAQDPGHDDGHELPPPSAPMAVARVMAARNFTHQSGVLVLRHWRGGWWRWQRSHWTETEHRAVREVAYMFTENATYAKGPSTERWAPNRHKIADVLESLAAIAFLPETVDQPTWTDTHDQGPIVACANGLLRMTDRTLLEHTPRFFNQTAVPFDYDADAPMPERWLTFLHELWPGDSDSIDALQEWFGYVISGRTDLQKILLWCGPTRSGKGATARVLGRLIGPDNVAGPTMSSLSGDFGLAPLLGKPLALIADARINGRNSTTVVERLLSISGEDTITVNRKFRDQWTGTLPARFMLLSNELPHFGDASTAIVGRFVILQTHVSWLGREDPKLEPDLHRELTGILNWALDGLDRLTSTRRFTRPKATDEAMIALQDLASPVAAFVRDRCVRDIGHEIAVDELFAAWKVWAEDNGQKAGTAQTFGRNLRAVIPGLRVMRPRDGEERIRTYLGVKLS